MILSAIVTTKLGGGLDFRVPVIGWKVKVGGSHSRQRTHTIDITLVTADLQDRHELRGSPVEETLVEAITTIRAVVAAGTGATTRWCSGPAPWNSSSVSPTRAPSRSAWRVS
ncbi:trypco2 family protein [Micromonospora sp. M12]